jgi:two-component system response regulator GlrR
VSETPAFAGIVRILVIDDDLELRAILQDLFAEEGYTSVAVDSLDAAVALLAQERFDLILTDSFAPTRQTLFDSAATLIPMAGGSPVVLFTAHPFDTKAARDAGFATAIAKPFDMDGMLAELAALIRHTGA